MSTSMSTTGCPPSAEAGRGDVDDDPNEISLAGIFDMQGYGWGEEIFDFVAEEINDYGWLNILEAGKERLRILTANTECDGTTAAHAYWDVRTRNGNKPTHAIVGCRCSSATTTLARMANLEHVPHLSPFASSIQLSDAEKFPYFSRLVPPDDARGEVGAAVTALRRFGWTKVSVLASDTQYSKDLANEFKKIWHGNDRDERFGNFNGEVVHHGTLQLTDDSTIDAASVSTELESLPKTSRVVLLIGHDQHIFQVLKLARGLTQPDTVWFGFSAWTGSRPSLEDASLWLPQIPGYIGIAPYWNQETQFHDDSLKRFQAYQARHGRQVALEFPIFWAGYMIDGIIAMVKTLVSVPPEMRRNGTLVTSTLRDESTLGDIDVDWLSGSIAFSPEGDRSNPRYSIVNLQRNVDGHYVWVDVGISEPSIGSAELFKADDGTGNSHRICFAEIGCSSKIPEDSRRSPLEFLTIALLVVIGILLLVSLDRCRRSRKFKNKLKTERKRFRESMVGLWAAKLYYVPSTTTAEDVDRPISESKDESNIDLEAAYRLQSCPKPEQSEQTQEIGNSPWPSRNQSRQVALENALRGVSHDRTPVPFNIRKEPQMVLVEGDIVQVSTQRDDGWAFGTKVIRANEVVARQLADLTMTASNVTTDSGWFPLKVARTPTDHELDTLKKKVGSTGSLHVPTNWSPDEKNLSTVRVVSLDRTNEEYMKVSKQFMSTMDSNSINIKNIQRIENLAMWQTYVVKRQTICYRDSATSIQTAIDDEDALLKRFERCWLWHGTDKNSMHKICQQGFNRSFCGRNAARLGDGVYFHRKASYSAHEKYAKPDPQSGDQHMLACRVAVGEYCVGRRGAKVPDLRDVATLSLYDSTVNRMTDPSIFVIYHDAQAYPEYIITFQKSRTSTTSHVSNGCSSDTSSTANSDNDDDDDDKLDTDDDDDSDDDNDDDDDGDNQEEEKEDEEDSESDDSTTAA